MSSQEMVNIPNITQGHNCLIRPKELKEILGKFLPACGKAISEDTPERIPGWLDSILIPTLELQDPVLFSTLWFRIAPSFTKFTYHIPFRLASEGSNWGMWFIDLCGQERVEAKQSEAEGTQFQVDFKVNDFILYADPLEVKRHMEAEVTRIRRSLQRRLVAMTPIVEEYNLGCRRIWAEEMQVQEARRKVMEIFAIGGCSTGPETSTPTPDIASRYERDLNI